MIAWINEAVDSGARKEEASQLLGLSIRTLQRWVEGDTVTEDRGEDKAILQKRDHIYELAKSRNPGRWSGNTRDWCPVGDVALNPEKEEITAVA